MLLCTAAVPLSAQESGTVSGRVVDASTQRPLSGAQVSIQGTTRRTVTNATGEYSITGVAPGTTVVRVSTVGYSAGTRSVAVTAGGTATANFSLSSSPVALDALVVTGTPGATQTRRTIGNAVSQVNAAAITESTPINSVSQLLQARTPGVTISTGSGTAGTAANISLRGLNTIYGNNKPLVFLDGVRVNTTVMDIGSGGQDYDILQNINPNDIESVEVIKGPAAATLYGSDAAAGVIQIITKKGRPGQRKVEFTTRAEYGQNEWKARIPTNYFTCRASAADPNAYVRNARQFPFDPSKPENGRPRNAAGNYINWFPGCANVDTLSTDPMARIISGQVLHDYLQPGETRNLNLTARGGGERYSFFVS
ncbi:MAG: TonB-dependent receptor plug domain-containing protein, partial [Gemmatimonadetes bacterium]|nr:TonB-dependent receptor plug domain-containing protein [Gemmatimonadota bacterium]